jgi:hypothetical protein
MAPPWKGGWVQALASSNLALSANMKNTQKTNNFFLDFSFKSISFSINIILLIFSPLVISVIYSLIFGFDFFAFIIGFATVVTFFFWVGIAGTFKKYKRKLSSLNFAIANFIFPLVMGIILHSDVQLIIWEVASFDFMALTLAVFAVMIVGLVGFHDKRFALFGALFFGVLMVVPVGISEYFWLQESGFSSVSDYFSLSLRYIAIILDAYILYKILYRGSIFT